MTTTELRATVYGGITGTYREQVLVLVWLMTGDWLVEYVPVKTELN